MELSNAAAVGIARWPASGSACSGAVITDGMKAMFVDGRSFLAEPCDMEQFSTQIAEIVSGKVGRTSA